MVSRTTTGGCRSPGWPGRHRGPAKPLAGDRIRVAARRARLGTTYRTTGGGRGMSDIDEEDDVIPSGSGDEPPAAPAIDLKNLIGAADMADIASVMVEQAK